MCDLDHGDYDVTYSMHDVCKVFPELTQGKYLLILEVSVSGSTVAFVFYLAMESVKTVMLHYVVQVNFVYMLCILLFNNKLSLRTG